MEAVQREVSTLAADPAIHVSQTHFATLASRTRVTVGFTLAHAPIRSTLTRTAIDNAVSIGYPPTEGPGVPND
jgi:hypothetical protein